MKKTLFALALAALTLSACNNNPSRDRLSDRGDKVETYAGVLPAADTDGILYTLTVKLDDDDNYMKGDYDLMESYLGRDTVAPTGYKSLKSVRSEGDVRVEQRDVNGTMQKYLKLIPDRKDSAPEASGDVMYFLVTSDSTLTMVGPDLTPSVNKDLNYTLVLKK